MTRPASPSPAFVRLTRDPTSPPPKRFEPTVKKPGDLVLARGQWVEVRPSLRGERA